jgi:hypothetical protein
VAIDKRPQLNKTCRHGFETSVTNGLVSAGGWTTIEKRRRAPLETIIADGPVVFDAGVELGDAIVLPSAADDGHEMSEHVALRDGAVDVGNDDLVRPLPQVHVAHAPARPLELGGH